MPLLNISQHLSPSFQVSTQMILYVREDEDETYTVSHSRGGNTLSHFDELLNGWITQPTDCILQLECYKSNLMLSIDIHKSTDVNLLIRLGYWDCVVLHKYLIPEEKFTKLKMEFENNIKYAILVGTLDEFYMEGYSDNFLDRFSKSKMDQWIQNL